jgi:hypothetical protein
MSQKTQAAMRELKKSQKEIRISAGRMRPEALGVIRAMFWDVKLPDCGVVKIATGPRRTKRANDPSVDLGGNEVLVMVAVPTNLEMDGP